MKSANTLISWSEELNIHKMPQWDSLPDLDLYMDQVVTYMERQMGVFMNDENDKFITSSMINNYVKDRLVPRPVQKKYSREHLGYLLTVCMLKQVLPIADISNLINSQKDKKEMAQLYNSFCQVQDEALQAVSVRVRDAAATVDDASGEDVLSMLALKLAVEANASRIAAVKILSLLEHQKNKPSGEGKKKSEP